MRGFTLYSVGAMLPLGDGGTATVGFLESSAEHVTVRVRFSAAEVMRSHSTGCALLVGVHPLFWELTVGGADPLAAVADVVFRGTVPADAGEVSLRLGAEGAWRRVALTRVPVTPPR